MRILDSRRLTGANLLMDAPGAVAELACPDDEIEAVIDAWREQARAMLDRVGLGPATLHVRRYAGGASLGFTAPIDVLYAATDVNEAALEAAQALARGKAPPSFDHTCSRLVRSCERERSPRLLALAASAAAHGLVFLSDDDFATAGLGTGSCSWPTNDLPHPDEVDWAALHDVPVLLVTGTNGKSTTVRLTAEMVRQAGLVPGLSSTDWIRVGDDVLDTGDYSGPGGARAVLRDRRTQVAILETARGGLLRRGLGCPRATAAAVLNVAEDHLGEWGIGDLAGLVEVKFLVSKALGSEGRLVLNADEAPVRARGTRSGHTPFWFGLESDQEQMGEAAATGGDACFVRDGVLQLVRAGKTQALVAEREIPITLGGRARFNTSNALAASALASCAGLPVEAIRAGLRAFESSPDANPGRGNVFELDGVTVFADFAHNPHGTRALFEMARAFEPRRALVLLGQAGDRQDDEIRALVEATWQGRPDKIIIKEMKAHLRGRPQGEMVALIERELLRAGAPREVIEHAPSEVAAVQQALRWAQPGDLLLLLLHAQREEALALLEAARATP
jgi:UDP-N-acetylmuramyl tripeptide synthase